MLKFAYANNIAAYFLMSKFSIIAFVFISKRIELVAKGREKNEFT
tara:strand:+ start:31700 stop:31834 length:135 start_codon:yes stop_codon:yes gene_type:complete